MKFVQIDPLANRDVLGVNAQRGNLPGLPKSLQVLFKEGFLSFRSQQNQAFRRAM